MNKFTIRCTIKWILIGNKTHGSITLAVLRHASRVLALIISSCFCVVRPHGGKCHWVKGRAKTPERRERRETERERLRAWISSTEQTAHMLLPWRPVQTSFKRIEQQRRGWGFTISPIWFNQQLGLLFINLLHASYISVHRNNHSILKHSERHQLHHVPGSVTMETPGQAPLLSPCGEKSLKKKKKLE